MHESTFDIINRKDMTYSNKQSGKDLSPLFHIWGGCQIYKNLVCFLNKIILWDPLSSNNVFLSFIYISASACRCSYLPSLQILLRVQFFITSSLGHLTLTHLKQNYSINSPECKKTVCEILREENPQIHG